MKLPAIASIALVSSTTALTQATPTLHYAPDRTYHLVRTVTKLDLDETRQQAKGSVAATISMLRDGITSVHFDTAADKVSSVLIDGKPAKFTFTKPGIEVTLNPGHRNDTHRIDFTIAGRFFRWTNPTAEEPNRIGFCAEGLPAQPVSWSPPNDLSATEIQITAPAAWTVISNGTLISDKATSKTRHTVTWRLDLPHAGYLNSLAAAPSMSFTTLGAESHSP